MGDRAHVAYQRGPDTYDLYYSHWGAGGLKLVNEIKEHQPLGGESSEPGFLTAMTSMLEDVADDADMEMTGRAAGKQETTEVDPTPTRIWDIDLFNDRIGMLSDEQHQALEANGVIEDGEIADGVSEKDVHEAVQELNQGLRNQFQDILSDYGISVDDSGVRPVDIDEETSIREALDIDDVHEAHQAMGELETRLSELHTPITDWNRAVSISLQDVLEISSNQVLYFASDSFDVVGYRKFSLPGTGLLFVSYPPELDRTIRPRIRGLSDLVGSLDADSVDVSAYESMLKEYVFSMIESADNAHILAASPDLEPSDYEDYPGAFLQVFGDDTQVSSHEWMDIREDGDWLTVDVTRDDFTTTLEPVVFNTDTMDTVVHDDKVNVMQFVSNDGECTGYYGFDFPGIGEIFIHNRPLISDLMVARYTGIEDFLSYLDDRGKLTEDVTNTVVHNILDSQRSLSKHVLALSPPFEEDEYKQEPYGFVTMSSLSAVFDKQLAGNYDGTEPWMTVTNTGDELDLPPSIPEIQDKPVPPSDFPRPEVKLPLGGSDLTIDGESYDQMLLPPELRDVWRTFVESFNNNTTQVHQCDECGYLTQSSNVGDYRNTYTCGGTWTEETTSMNGTTAGMWGAPFSWNIELLIDGDHSRMLTGEDEQPTYELVVTQYDEYHYEADELDSTSITLSNASDTVTGETNGFEWEADVKFFEETVRIDWRLLNNDGTVMTYTYEPADRNPDRELVGTNLDADEIDDEHETVGFSTQLETRISDRECNSQEFTRVWPPDRVYNDDDVLNLHSVTVDDVPNSKQHLTKMRNTLGASITQDEFLRQAADIAAKYEYYADAFDDYTGDQYVDPRDETGLSDNEEPADGLSQQTIADFATAEQ